MYDHPTAVWRGLSANVPIGRDKARCFPIAYKQLHESSTNTSRISKNYDTCKLFLCLNVWLYGKIGVYLIII